MKNIASAVGLALAATLSVGTAEAGHQTCGSQIVPESLRRCPDGSPPMFHADTVNPAPPAAKTPQQQQGPVAEAASLFGVWHTGVSGGVWQTPSAVPGWDTLHVAPGVRAGDLTITPNGRFVWNAYGGKAGRWVPGDAEYPIVLVDDAEHRRWKVGPDRRHPGKIFIWDGTFTYVGSR